MIPRFARLFCRNHWQHLRKYRIVRGGIMTELKPCPFCGNTKLNEKVGCRERTRYSIIFGTETIENWFDCVISCSCGTSLELSGFDLPLTAQVETEKAWNTRDGEVEE